jgi:hypothetical protein
MVQGGVLPRLLLAEQLLYWPTLNITNGPIPRFGSAL